MKKSSFVLFTGVLLAAFAFAGCSSSSSSSPSDDGTCTVTLVNDMATDITGFYIETYDPDVTEPSGANELPGGTLAAGDSVSFEYASGDDYMICYTTASGTVWFDLTGPTRAPIGLTPNSVMTFTITAIDWSMDTE